MSYTYDTVGNRTQKTSTLPGFPGSGVIGYNANDQLTADTYDNDGNTTGSGTNTGANGYVYDFENHLIQQGGITIVYDGDGNRVSKTTASGTISYLVDDVNPTGYAQVLAETGLSNNTTQYVYGLERISIREYFGAPTNGFNNFFYVYDGHGSVRALTNSAGVVTDTYDYDAFGVQIHSTGTTPNNYLYSGEQYDPDLHLYYNRARYLNTGTGRFWSMDTAEGDISSPLSLHEYLFTNDDSINVLDPSGHEGIDELMASLSISNTLNAMSFFSAMSVRDFSLVINWKNQFFWRDESLVRAEKKDQPLTSGEIATIKQTSLETAQRAFSAFPMIHVYDGGQSRDVFNVVNGREMVGDILSLGSTSPFCFWKGPCSDSKIFYDEHLIDAQEVTQNDRGRNTQARQDYIPAIGRGIGRTIAHEFGHRYGLQFMHEGAPNEYNSGAQKVSDLAQWFAVPDLKWGDKVFEQIRRLTANQSPY